MWTFVFQGFCEVIGSKVRIESWMIFPALFDRIGGNFKKAIVIMKKNWLSKFYKK